MGAFTAFIIGRALENIVMTGGIIYAACYFEKMSLLWFLLLPAGLQLNFTSSVKGEKKDG